MRDQRPPVNSKFAHKPELEYYLTPNHAMTAQPSASAMPTNIHNRILPIMPGLRLMATSAPAVAQPMPMDAPAIATPVLTSDWTTEFAISASIYFFFLFVFCCHSRLIFQRGCKFIFNDPVLPDASTSCPQTPRRATRTRTLAR